MASICIVMASDNYKKYLATHKSRRSRWVHAKAVILGDSNRAAICMTCKTVIYISVADCVLHRYQIACNT